MMISANSDDNISQYISNFFYSFIVTFKRSCLPKSCLAVSFQHPIQLVRILKFEKLLGYQGKYLVTSFTLIISFYVT